MISETTKAEIERLRQLQDSYQPNDSIKTALQHKTIIMLVAATCQGKSTVIQAASQLDPRIGTAGNFTTRSPRTDETGMTYYNYNDDDLQKLFAKITARELVQYIVHPTGHMYGSELSDYPYAHNLKEVLSSAVGAFERIGFGQTKTVTLVSNPERWLSRFEERFPVGNEQRQVRRDEAIQSFTWSLMQPENTMYWVENIDGDATVAAKAILDIGLGTYISDPTARTLAEQSLQLAKEIQA